jgi:tRNA(Ile)-lysidine synthase
VTDLLDQVRGAGLLAPGRPTVVLYSGGRDSTCLLDLAVRIAGAEVVHALHVNYAMRDAADDDERHCREACERVGVRLDVRHPRRLPAPPAKPVVGNVQAWARDQRYGAATQLALKLGGDVAAGHTATDQVETILYRLASSPSRRALLGMRPRDGGLIRPLLAVTREQTAAHCVARGLDWCEDASNDSDAYARNRVRRQLVPALESAHPAAQANVLALAELLRDEAQVLDQLVQSALDGRQEISLVRLRELAPALRRLVVQRLADAAAGEPAAGVARRADEVAAMSDTRTAALDLPHGVRATATRGMVRFGRTPRRLERERPNQGAQPDDSGAARFGEAGCRASRGPERAP